MSGQPANKLETMNRTKANDPGTTSASPAAGGQRASIRQNGPSAPSKNPATGAKDHFWEVRMWSGMMPRGWFRILWRNRFHVAPRRIGMACILSVLSLLNLVLWMLQTIFFGRTIEKTRIEKAPLFVLGHWRTGTTLLHELFAMDPRHTYPDTYASYMPNHFLLSARLFKGWAGIFLPSRRPMDNMTIRWDVPQEDEWALCNMGIPSPYLWLIFPNRPRPYQEYLDLRNVPPAALAKWKTAFLWFLKCLTIQNPGRIVLKSPQHTCRVRTLLDMFPDARFVHIVRDPFVIFPSTMKTWDRLAKYHGLQKPTGRDTQEFVFETFNHMQRVFEEDRQLVNPGQFYEIRYEDLVADPVGQMRTLYQKLQLGDFEPARPAIEAYVEKTKDYQISQYQLPAATRQEIARRWGAYSERYGYDNTTGSP